MKFTPPSPCPPPWLPFLLLRFVTKQVLKQKCQIPSMELQLPHVQLGCFICNTL